jgi:hypothetical protein
LPWRSSKTNPEGFVGKSAKIQVIIGKRSGERLLLAEEIDR